MNTERFPQGWQSIRPLMPATFLTSICIRQTEKSASNNISKLPYPIWFKVVNLLVIPAAIVAGSRFSGRRKTAGPGEVNWAHPTTFVRENRRHSDRDERNTSDTTRASAKAMMTRSMVKLSRASTGNTWVASIAAHL